jgi:hypothetical protein
MASGPSTASGCTGALGKATVRIDNRRRIVVVSGCTSLLRTSSPQTDEIVRTIGLIAWENESSIRYRWTRSLVRLESNRAANDACRRFGACEGTADEAERIGEPTRCAFVQQFGDRRRTPAARATLARERRAAGFEVGVVELTDFADSELLGVMVHHARRALTVIVERINPSALGGARVERRSFDGDAACRCAGFIDPNLVRYVMPIAAISNW